MTKISRLSSRRTDRGQVRSLLLSSIISARGKVQVLTVEHKYKHTSRLGKGLTIDIDY